MGSSSRLATTPSSAPPAVAEPCPASRQLVVVGDSRRDGRRHRRQRSARARRGGRSKRRSPARRRPRSSRSNRISRAGVSAASLRMRLSAGCRRICSASKDRLSPTGMVSSPSRTKSSAGTARKRGDHFGEITVQRLAGLGEELRPAPPSLKARQRKPSHLGSNGQPASAGQRVDEHSLHGLDWGGFVGHIVTMHQTDWGCERNRDQTAADFAARIAR